MGMEAYYKKIAIVGVVLAMVMVANGDGLCQMSRKGLKACEPSVSGENAIPPTPACCSALSNADLQCLCRFKDSGLLSLYGIDPDQAMQLPVKCNLVEPSFHC